jgi:hypothetical protein
MISTRAQITAFFFVLFLSAAALRAQPSGKIATQDLGKNHWAFKKPIAPAVPTVKRSDWPVNEIDRFILARLESQKLAPSPDADRRTLIRRATFDLLGLPPTDAEVGAFVADNSSDAYEKLIDRLLASPHYGERWGRHWLDLARYSDTKGYVYEGEERLFVHAHAYRDWVVRAFNSDLPYDKFILLQVAADQLVPADARDNGDLAAMGFLTVGRRFLGVSHDIIDDRIDVLTRTTLGLTVACARCHDHKFDPIPTQDYYSLYGVFINAIDLAVPLGPTPPPSDAYKNFLDGYKTRADKLQSKIDEREAVLLGIRRAHAGDYLQAVLDIEKLPTELFTALLNENDLNPLIARQWHSYLFKLSKGPPDPVFAPWIALQSIPAADFAAKSPAVLQKLLADASHPLNPLVAQKFSAAPPPASMQQVADRYGQLFDEANTAWIEANKTAKPAVLPDPAQESLRQLLYGPDSPMNFPIGTVEQLEMYFDITSRDAMRRLQGEIDRWILSATGAPSYAIVLNDVPDPKPARVFKRGNPATRAEDVPRQFLGVIAGFGPRRKPFEKGSGRLELAQAIVSRDNPLTARVMVNRLWAHHFGVGLVATPSDFGARCPPPTHPQLLDYLAIRFMDERWSVKKIQRLVMLSRTYQQSSGDRADGRAADPENRLLWRMNRTRLDFEEMRDALLAACEQLDTAVGGRAVETYQPPFSLRRTLYGKIDRQFVPGVLRVFDFANPDLHIPSRVGTTVPQQALFFMNSPFVVERARALVSRPEVAAVGAAEEKIRRLYRALYQREPAAAEIAAGIEFVAKVGRPVVSVQQPGEPIPPPPLMAMSPWEAYAQVLLLSNEFLFVD